MKILEIFSSILTPSRAGRVLQVRSLCQSVSTKEDKVALKELFPNLVKDGHSNPEITKMIAEMGEAKVGWESAKLLDLKIWKRYGEYRFARVKQPDIIGSVTRGLLVTG